MDKFDVIGMLICVVGLATFAAGLFILGFMQMIRLWR